jgi:hypothetical protein
MRFARGDMKDHIVSHKNDHGASYRRYEVLPWRSRPKINFCEIFDVVRFSTFATLSATTGLEQCRISGQRSTALRFLDLPSVAESSDVIHSAKARTARRCRLARGKTR